MDLFALPPSTKVNRVIPKNAFDSFVSSKQKRLFTDLVSRIVWTHKISSETVNLESKEIAEIQLFRIELKVHQEIKSVLDLIDKAIPYHIIFVVTFGDQVQLSTSVKHAHPVKADQAVIDWTLKTDWFTTTSNPYSIQLKKSIDSVFEDFCNQLSGHSKSQPQTLNDIVTHQRRVAELEKEIAQLRSKIANCKQFNQKVELNLNLKKIVEKYVDITNNNQE
jgi:hypothetical protein